jgi:hypothetical protein
MTHPELAEKQIFKAHSAELPHSNFLIQTLHEET